MLRTLTIFGTRPEAIKMAPLVKALESQAGIQNRVCVTAQHREMLDQVLSVFDINPEYDLKVMAPNQDLSDVTGKILARVRDVLRIEKPDIVFVHGDTTTCFASALAAFYEGAKIAHVEAGLRTGSISTPFPEEGNRRLVGRLANLHFSPTQKAKGNLLKENVDEEQIFVTGNTVIDALYWMVEKNKSFLEEHWIDYFGVENFLKFSEKDRRIVLITGHRRESFGKGFVDICKAIGRLAKNFPDVLFVYPVHLNPHVNNVVRATLSDRDNVILLQPLCYEAFIWLMDKSYIILTDSGGIQEEGPSLGKPVLVMRETTERPEAVVAGTVRLVGTDSEMIYHHVNLLLTNGAEYNSMSRAINPYGDGLATQRIIHTCLSMVEGGSATCLKPIKEFA